MRRIQVTAPPAPLPAPPPKAETRRAKHVARADAPCNFPAEAAFWTIRSEEGEALFAETARGIESSKFPIADFTTDTIRKRWGVGSFSVGFTDRAGKARGRNKIRIAGAPAVAPEAEEPVRTPLVAVDPWERAMQLFSVVKSASTAEANTAIERDRAFLAGAQANAATMFQAAMGHARERDAAAGAALPSALTDYLTKLDAKVDALAARLDDEDDLDDQDDDDDAPAERPMPPEFPETWQGFGDFAYRVIVQNMPAIQKAAPDLIRGFMRNLEAAHAKALQQNGAAVAAGGAQS